MNTNGNSPLEEEFRSSQVYKTLEGAGAGRLADSVGKAVAGIEGAINGFTAGMAGQASNRPQGRPGQNQGQPYYKNYRQGAGPAPQPRPTNKVPPGYRQQQAAYQQPPQTWQTARQPPPAPPPAPAPQARYQQGPQPRRPQGVTPAPPPAPAPQARYQQGPQPRRPQGVTPAPPPQMPPMKLVYKGSPAKFYITGAAAVLYSQLFPLHDLAHFGVFALVLVLVFLGSAALFKGKKQFVPIEPEKPKEEPKPQPKEEEKPSRTGNPEVDKLIDEGSGYLKKLRAANDAIPDEALSEDIDRMERASADIFHYIADHPQKAPQIRKFMNYYLPTTLKLLNSYERLSKQSVKGENITSTMFNIAGMMHTVADAFEKQLDSLFTDEAMDISADITVFESMLKQEGFVEEKK